MGLSRRRECGSGMSPADEPAGREVRGLDLGTVGMYDGWRCCEREDKISTSWMRDRGHF